MDLSPVSELSDPSIIKGSSELFIIVWNKLFLLLLSDIILGNNGEAVSVLLFFIGAGLSTDAENVA